MRFVLCLACLPGLAWADDVTTLAPVTAAELYLSGGLLTREVVLDLPAGTHRVLVPRAIGSSPRVSVIGATLGPVETLPASLIDGRVAFTEIQRAAYVALEDAEQGFDLAEDALLRAASGMKAAEDALAMLRSLSGAQLQTLQPDAVGPFAAAVTSNITAAEIARADAKAALRQAEDAHREAILVRDQARQAFEATGASEGVVSQMAIGVTLDAPGQVSLSIEAFNENMGWAPHYDISLGSDNRVTFDRKAVVWQRSGLAFEGVDLTLSTVNPYAQIAPRDVYANRATLKEDYRGKDVFSRSSADSVVMGDSEGSMEAGLSAGVGDDVVVVGQALTANAEGVVVTHDYPVPLSIAPTGTPVTLALDTVSTDARVFNRASVRRDKTAFLMAGITNTIGEPLLPGAATFYRDGTRIGEATLPLIPAGDAADLSFGPQQFLRVEFAILENQTGDRGLFSTSGTRTQDLVFRIRNLSRDVTEVEARYALPFSEEEDLEIELTANPNPDVTDIDDAQGVSDWVLTVPPTGESEVEIQVSLEWPEGQTLNWSP